MNLRSLSSSFVRKSLLALGAVTALASAADATWSIVLVDRSTGEVAIGCATCLESLDLETLVPVMVTGVGGACAQSQIDGSGRNRKYIFNKLQEGMSPADILINLASFDGSHQSRQYGIVDMVGRRETFSGTNDGPWAGGVAGTIGTIDYAIQGNVLTGQQVVLDAQNAVLTTPGDLAEKLMAAMEAAQADGGDGRCSCSTAHPDSCGSPPTGFDPTTDKSSHIGFMIISRIGDVDGGCDSTIGCANGSYYMNFNVANQTSSDIDPVLQLRSAFDAWRNSLKGHADHIKSTTSMSRTKVPGNGTKQVTLSFVLNDWENHAIGHGGATVDVHHSAKSDGLSTIGTPVDNGDGSYDVAITAGVGLGLDEYEIVVDDGVGPVTLFPLPTLRHNATLRSDVTRLSAAAGGDVNFDLFGPENANPPGYLVLCTTSGTSPGINIFNLVLPLNFDDVMLASYLLRNTPNFVNTEGQLAPDGTATAQFHVDANDLTALIGAEFDFAYLTHGSVLFTSNALAVTIDP